MKAVKELSDWEKWVAVISCNADYDGSFYYAVITTGIFCKPSCKSKTPNRRNVQFFDSADEALRSGFRSCKRCCPDQDGMACNPAALIVIEAQEYIRLQYRTRLTLDDLAARVGVSPYHFNRIFKEKTGITPRRYLEKIRLEEACRLLSATSLSVTEIGYRVGFQSLSGFYAAFQRQLRITPTSIREETVQ